MAFVVAYGIVHHSGTKRLNQVAWSASPQGSMLQRWEKFPSFSGPPMWHSTVHKPFSSAFPTMQNRSSTVRFFVMWRKDTIRCKARSVLKHYVLYMKMFHTWVEWEEEPNITGGGIPSSTTVLYSVWLSGIQNWCQSVFIQLSADPQVLLPRRLSIFHGSPTFMRQPVIQRYRFISPIKTPCRCPRMSRPWLLICSPRFSAWLINSPAILPN